MLPLKIDEKLCNYETFHSDYVGFTLFTGHEAVRENRDIAILCFKTWALEGVRG
jgi:hypothetical protein